MSVFAEVEKSISAGLWDQALEKLIALKGEADSSKVFSRLVKLNAVRGRFLTVLSVYLEWSESALANGDFAQAETSYEYAMALRPQAPEVHHVGLEISRAKGELDVLRERLLELAHLYIELGEGDRSIPLVEEAIDTCPDDDSLKLQLAEVHISLGHIQNGLKIYQDFVDERADTASPDCLVEPLRRLNLLRPDHIDSQLHLGNVLLKTERIDQAEEQFRGVLKSDIKNEEALLGLAAVCQVKGMMRNGLLALNRLLAANPYHALAHRRMGEMHLLSGQPEKAIHEIIEAARLYAEAGKTDIVADLYRAVYRIDQENPWALNGISAMGLEFPSLPDEDPPVEDVRAQLISPPNEPNEESGELAEQEPSDSSSSGSWGIKKRPRLIRKGVGKGAGKPTLGQERRSESGLRVGLRRRTEIGDDTDDKPIFRPKFEPVSEPVSEPEPETPIELGDSAPPAARSETAVEAPLLPPKCVEDPEPDFVTHFEPIDEPLDELFPQGSLFPKIEDNGIFDGDIFEQPSIFENDGDTEEGPLDILFPTDEEGDLNNLPVVDEEPEETPVVLETLEEPVDPPFCKESQKQSPEQVEVPIDVLFPSDEVEDPQTWHEETPFRLFDPIEEESEESIFKGFPADEDEEPSLPLTPVTDPIADLDSETIALLNQSLQTPDPELVNEAVRKPADVEVASAQEEPLPALEELVIPDPVEDYPGVKEPEPVVALDAAGRIESYQEVLTLRPTDEQTIADLADTCMQFGMLEEALVHYRDLQKLNPGCLKTATCIIKAALWLEDVPTVKSELWRAANLSFDRGDLQSCGDRLGDLLSLDRDHKEARRLMIDVFVAGGDEKLAAWHLSQMVERCVADSDIDEAIDYLSRLQDIAPSQSATERLGELYQQQHRVTEATATFRRLRDEYARSSQLESALRLAHRVVQLDPQAIQDRQHLIALLEQRGEHETVVIERLELARLHHQSAEYEQAIALLSEVLESHPDHLDAECLLVEVYLRNQSHELAEQHSESLAERFLAHKSYQKAIGLFEYWVGAAPANTRARERLAQFYQLSGDLECAKMEWSLVTEQHQAAGQFERAARSLERALELEPNHQEWRLRLAILKAQELKDIDSALAELRHLFEQDPGWRKATVTYLDLLLEHNRMAELGDALASVLPNSGLRENTIRSVQEKMTREPNNLDLVFGWGELCLSLDMLDAAIEQFQRLRRYEQYRLQSYRLLGLCFSRKRGYNMTELALSQFRKGLALPDESDIDKLPLHYDMATLLQAHDRTEEALAAYNECLRIDADYSDVAERIARMQARDI